MLKQPTVRLFHYEGKIITKSYGTEAEAISAAQEATLYPSEAIQVLVPSPADKIGFRIAYMRESQEESDGANG